MATDLRIDVSALDPPHRRALEEVIGHRLEENQRLTISVTEVKSASTEDTRPAQLLEEWTSIYEGLSADEVEAIDKIINTRANLTRDVP
jgi:hypothetical protein